MEFFNLSFQVTAGAVLGIVSIRMIYLMLSITQQSIASIKSNLVNADRDKVKVLLNSRNWHLVESTQCPNPKMIVLIYKNRECDEYLKIGVYRSELKKLF